MLKRKAEEQIRSWIARSSKSLLVSGARQVSKTHSIRKCLKEADGDWLEINLIREPELIPMLEKSASAEDLMSRLAALRNHPFRIGKTILFIDEIQEAKDAMAKVQRWTEAGCFRSIFSGSLLGIELKGLRPVPEGALEEIEMFPMDFEDFLLASGVQKATIDELKACLETLDPIEAAVHRKMTQLFQRYLIVGGMPAAVQKYMETGNLAEVSNIQRNILRLHQRDFAKYEKMEKRLTLASIYDQIPSLLMKQNRRFRYSELQKGLRFEKLEDSFRWLAGAGVTIPAYSTASPRRGLGQNRKPSMMKLYASDVGLLTCQYDSAVRTEILTGESKANLGGIYENAVAQALNAQRCPLFFYNSPQKGELDFLIEAEKSVVPIEVRSGKDYYVHSALSKALSHPEYGIQKACVLSGSNLYQEDRIVHLPVYLCMYLTTLTA